MNLSELSFLNRQLAALIQDGVPLEGALRQAAVDLRGPLRTEIEALESDLSRGTPLVEAISRRRLPPLYLHLVRTGIAGGNLPTALAASADHFDERIRLQRRVQAALFYPIVVLILGIGICFLALGMGREALTSVIALIGQPTMGLDVALTFVRILLGLFVTLLLATTIPPLQTASRIWSRVRARPWFRTKYSRRPYSFGVSSTGWPARVSRFEARSSIHSPNVTWSGRALRRRLRNPAARASSSWMLNGLVT